MPGVKDIKIGDLLEEESVSEKSDSSGYGCGDSGVSAGSEL